MSRSISMRAKTLFVKATDVFEAIKLSKIDLGSSPRPVVIDRIGCTCIPPDAIMDWRNQRVDYDHAEIAFRFLVEHPSFEEVSGWDDIPVIRCQCKLSVATVKDSVTAIVDLLENEGHTEAAGVLRDKFPLSGG